MATVEGIGTCLLVFALGAGASGLTLLRVSPMAISLYAALLNAIGLSLFIFAAAPASGGHLNPSITMATFFAGLSTLPRSLLYVVAQTLGAIVAGYWLKLGLGEEYFPTVSSQNFGVSGFMSCPKGLLKHPTGRHTRLHRRRNPSISRTAIRIRVYVRFVSDLPRVWSRSRSTSRQNTRTNAEPYTCRCNSRLRDSCVFGG